MTWTSEPWSSAESNGAAIPAAVIGDEAVAVAGEVEGLAFPAVRVQRRAMTQHDRLTGAGAPILVMNGGVVAMVMLLIV